MTAFCPAQRAKALFLLLLPNRCSYSRALSQCPNCVGHAVTHHVCRSAAQVRRSKLDSPRCPSEAIELPLRMVSRAALPVAAGRRLRGRGPRAPLAGTPPTPLSRSQSSRCGCRCGRRRCAGVRRASNREVLCSFTANVPLEALFAEGAAYQAARRGAASQEARGRRQPAGHQPERCRHRRPRRAGESVTRRPRGRAAPALMP
jgi:hypothetical protein